MAISLRNVTSVSQTSATTIAIDKPTGVVDGDVMYVAIWTVAGLTHASLAGWTEVASTDNAVDALVTVLRRVASGEGSSYTFTVSPDQTPEGAIWALVGVDNVTPEDATATGTSSSGASVIAPTITTVTNNAWHNAVFQTLQTQQTLSLPSGYTNDVPTYGVAAANLMRVDHKLITPAGATGTATSTADVSGTWLTISLAIRPAAAGGAPSGFFASQGPGWGGLNS